MGIFDKFKKHEKINNKLYYSKCIKIAGIIANDNGDVINEITKCVNDPNGYFESNKEKYKERSIYNADNIDTIVWVGMVDILIKRSPARTQPAK